MKLKILLEVVAETNSQENITTSILEDVRQHFNTALIGHTDDTDYCDVEKVKIRSIIKLDNRLLQSA